MSSAEIYDALTHVGGTAERNRLRQPCDATIGHCQRRMSKETVRFR